MTGPTKHLPFAIGGCLEPGGGDSARAESITRDAGEPAKQADSRPQPKEPVQPQPDPPVPAPAADRAPALAAPPPQAYESMEDIDALHARFDAMETYIKRSMTIVTLHARFDALEAYLKARLG